MLQVIGSLSGGQVCKSKLFLNVLKPQTKFVRVKDCKVVVVKKSGDHVEVLVEVVVQAVVVRGGRGVVLLRHARALRLGEREPRAAAACAATVAQHRRRLRTQHRRIIVCAHCAVCFAIANAT